MSNSTRQPKNSSKKSFSSRPLRFWQDEQSNQSEVRIEIIPLIDVIFCILTFFILGAVGLSRQQAISLDLPKASTGTAQMREMLVVSLDDFGQVYVEQQLVTRNQLYEAIKNYHQFNPGGLMVLNASRTASYNEVIQVLDLLRQVGGDRVALATLPGDNTSGGITPYTNTNPIPNMNNQQPFPSSPNPSFNPAAPSVPIPPAINNTPQTTQKALPGN
ncbi:biopolymer transporter ExbD [Chroococcus sp. FPU101]|uniref:ExbD/TolR family protein n=1 Tax=Chroococcus sp. FPU101 TaxID=1974212 RepID=UPI001A8D480D|nr:biopolymer transporter ExbD [Chroococcus sp. FPU101]GFE69994.1 Biopolymer transport protein ExbD/TolR [Chroococcus sp. FPU101]